MTWLIRIVPMDSVSYELSAIHLYHFVECQIDVVSLFHIHVLLYLIRYSFHFFSFSPSVIHFSFVFFF